ncbi:putative ABC transporter permease YknZ [bioreactor metagenome]|uniref:Putative ABC transporter permease YknZ n=2 Tax=root TaxID=1 RepID=A0A645HSR1_9ZZZZ
MVYNKDSGTKAYIPYSLAYQIQDSSIGFKNLTVVPREEVDAKEFLISTSAYFESYYVSNEKITAVTSSMASMLKSMNKMLDQIKLGIGGVAAISLLVGGIGVMNIMMVSVTERTREIGIRMALGAKGSIIRFQFLVEAMMVSLCGGIIGIVMGLSIGAIVANVMKYQAKPSLFVILSSVLFSLAIGMFFGYMPANKASQLDPIEALRYE